MKCHVDFYRIFFTSNIYTESESEKIFWDLLKLYRKFCLLSYYLKSIYQISSVSVNNLTQQFLIKCHFVFDTLCWNRNIHSSISSVDLIGINLESCLSYCLTVSYTGIFFLNLLLPP